MLRRIGAPRLPRSAMCPQFGLTEAYIVNLRSAANVVGRMAAYCAATKPRQAPAASLNDLLQWVKKNPTRVRPEVLGFIQSDWSWFYQMRTMRDLLVHAGLHANVVTNRKPYSLSLYSPKRGWIPRKPLFPILPRWTTCLIDRTDQCGKIVQNIYACHQSVLGLECLKASSCLSFIVSLRSRKNMALLNHLISNLSINWDATRPLLRRYSE